MAVSRKKPVEVQRTIRWPFGKKNYILFGVAIAVAIIGYIALGRGSMTLAPILLVLAYCVLMPLSIIIKDHPEDSVSETDEEPAG
jgi:hypothetical protein